MDCDGHRAPLVRLFLLGMIGSLSSLGCSAPPPPTALPARRPEPSVKPTVAAVLPTSSVAPAPAQAPPAPRPLRFDLIDIAITSVPEDFAFDGAVSEWVPVTEDTTDTATRLAVAVGPTSATIAGVLGADARDGVWISIAFFVPAAEELRYPHIRTNCLLFDDNGDTTGHDSVCEAYARREATFREKLERQFERAYRLDVNRLQVFEKGSLRDVRDFQIERADVDGDRTSVEVTFPLSELPPMATIPLDRYRVYADFATDAPPQVPVEAWISGEQETPFEPALYPKLLGQIMSTCNVPYDRGPGAFWLPSDPLHVRMIEYVPGEELKAHRVMTRPLFTAEKAFGDISLVATHCDYRVTMHDGDFVSQTRHSSLDAVKVLPRGDSYYLVEPYVRRTRDNSHFNPFYWAEWYVSFVSPDGSAVNALEPPPGFWNEFERVEMRHSLDYETIAFVGRPVDDDREKGHRREFMWKLDDPKHRYRFVGVRDLTAKDKPSPLPDNPANVLPRKK